MSNRKGIALFVVMIIIVVASVIVYAAMKLSMTGTKTAHYYTNDQKAFYASEAGLEAAMAKIRKVYSDPTLIILEPYIPLPFPTSTGETYNSTHDYYEFTLPGDPPLVVRYRIREASGWQRYENSSTKTYVVDSGLEEGQIAQCILRQEIAITRTYLFNWGIFFEHDLEILPGPSMEFFGPVHTNMNCFMGSGGTLNFYDKLTAALHITRTRKNENKASGRVYVNDGNGDWTTMPAGPEMTTGNDAIIPLANYHPMDLDSALLGDGVNDPEHGNPNDTWKVDPAWRNGALDAWHGYVRDYSHGIRYQATPAYGSIDRGGYYEQKAGLKLITRKDTTYTLQVDTTWHPPDTTLSNCHQEYVCTKRKKYVCYKWYKYRRWRHGHWYYYSCSTHGNHSYPCCGSHWVCSSAYVGDSTLTCCAGHYVEVCLDTTITPGWWEYDSTYILEVKDSLHVWAKNDSDSVYVNLDEFPPGTFSFDSLYDNRAGRHVMLTTVDQLKLMGGYFDSTNGNPVNPKNPKAKYYPSHFPENGVIYASREDAVPNNVKPYGYRVKNAEILRSNIYKADSTTLNLDSVKVVDLTNFNEKTILRAPRDPTEYSEPSIGMTFVSNNVVYAVANFNLHQDALGNELDPMDSASYDKYSDLWRPVAFISDAFKILSPTYKDNLSWSNETGGDVQTVTQDWELNAVILTGHIQTHWEGSSVKYSGGLENFPRFIENWRGRRLKIRGSFIELWESTFNNANWRHTGNKTYNPPHRNWGYDVRFQNIFDLPPLFMEFFPCTTEGVFVTGGWSEISKSKAQVKLD